jgi:hypothetical protein
MKKNKKNKLLSWFKKGSFAVIDQAIFAGSNFLVNVLLARSLSQADYGIFAQGFSIYLLVGLLYNSFLIEPLTVFGSGSYSQVVSKYLKPVEKMHWLLSGLLLIIYLVVTLILALRGESLWALTLLGQCIAGPFVYYSFLMRRYCYVISEPQYISRAAILYCLTMIASVSLFSWIEKLNPLTAFLSIGISAFVCAFVIRAKVIALKIQPSKTIRKNQEGGKYKQGKPISLPELGQGKKITVQDIALKHWNYGKWAILSNSTGWLPLNIPLLFAGSGVAGLELAARLKASLNLNVPVSQFLTALANYLIPSFAKTYSNPEKTDNKIEYKALIIYGIITGVYALFIVVFGEEISRALYKGRYTFNQYELLILTLIPITGGLQRVFAASFRALERSKLLLIPSVAASGIVVIFCPILIPILGFSGALLSVVIAFAVSLLVSYVTWAEEKKSFHARKESGKQV